MVGSGGLGFWGGKPPIDQKGSSSVGGDLLLTVGLVGSGGGGSGSGESGKLSKWMGSMDTPTLNHVFKIGFYKENVDL